LLATVREREKGAPSAGPILKRVEIDALDAASIVVEDPFPVDGEGAVRDDRDLHARVQSRNQRVQEARLDADDDEAFHFAQRFERGIRIGARLARSREPTARDGVEHGEGAADAIGEQGDRVVARRACDRAYEEPRCRGHTELARDRGKGLVETAGEIDDGFAHRLALGGRERGRALGRFEARLSMRSSAAPMSQSIAAFARACCGGPSERHAAIADCSGDPACASLSRGPIGRSRG
jgi:hypothetical protein